MRIPAVPVRPIARRAFRAEATPRGITLQGMRRMAVVRARRVPAHAALLQPATIVRIRITPTPAPTPALAIALAIARRLRRRPARRDQLVRAVVRVRRTIVHIIRIVRRALDGVRARRAPQCARGGERVCLPMARRGGGVWVSMSMSMTTRVRVRARMAVRRLRLESRACT